MPEIDEARLAREAAEISRVLGPAECVLALWRDDTKETGVDVLVLFGTNRLTQLFAAGESPLVPAAVYLVRDRAEAWELRDMFEEATFGAGPEPS